MVKEQNIDLETIIYDKRENVAWITFNRRNNDSAGIKGSCC